MIWFTSDTHFNHANINDYCGRPFRDLEEMTEALIQAWNERVQKGDAVYHLGDFALSWGRKHAAVIDEILARLNGRKHLIIGNHDRKEVVENKRWALVSHYAELKVANDFESVRDAGRSVHKQRIVMSHYPFRVWNQSHRGAWMLHGHSHGNLVDIGGKILDVGVDNHNFRPISLEEVARHMAQRVVAVVDHHLNETPVE